MDTNVKFKFVLKEVTKRKATYAKRIKEYVILEKKVIALCCISLSGDYYVRYNDNVYPLTKNSYKLNTNRMYSQQLVDKRNVLKVTLQKENKHNPEYFLPFAPSIYLKGNIIQFTGTNKIYFDLIESLDFKDDNSKEQFIFYKNNYETIHEQYLCHLQLVL